MIYSRQAKGLQVFAKSLSLIFTTATNVINNVERVRVVREQRRVLSGFLR